MGQNRFILSFRANLEKTCETLYNKPMLCTWFAYCLELGDGFYYVGISQDPAHRIHSHKTGQGSQLSRRHGFKSVIGVWDIKTTGSHQAMLIENNITECLHYALGEKVRGGSYCTEEVAYVKNGLGWRYLDRFENVTQKVLDELNLIELRGWG